MNPTRTLKPYKIPAIPVPGIITLWVIALFSFSSFQANAQVGDQVLTKIANWNAYVHMPDDYDANPTKKYPVIVFVPGSGEVGTDASKLLVYGPSYYIKQGHNMQFTVNGLIEKPIVISIQPSALWPSENVMNTRVDSILKRWRIDETRVYVTGLSMGGFAWDNYITGNSNYAKKITAIVAMSAVEPNYPLTNLRPYALNGGKWWGFEGTTDYRKMDLIRDTMNRIVPGSARYTKYVGGHCCWNTWYNPAWVENGDNIYSWMLKQKLPPQTPTPNMLPVLSVTSDTAIVLPTNSITLTCNATDPDGSITGYAWTKISGPTQFTIETPTAKNTKVSSLIQGMYSFSVAVTDSRGDVSRDTVNVTVNPTSMMSNCGCDYILQPALPTDDYIYVNVKNAGIKPGDKVCIMSGVYDRISIEGLKGTAEKPITIINCGGLVEMKPATSYGFRMVKSSFFRLTGTGAPGIKYGFRLQGIGDGTPPGLAMSDSMTDFEIDHFDVSGVSAGFYIKTSPKDCDPGSWEGAWEMKNMKIHDNYIHNTTGEGFYLGHTAYTASVVNCSGATVTVGTQTMRNLKVYNNIVDSTGWDGIQVASTPEGVEIYNNIVTNYGMQNMSSQQGGILLGGRSNGKVFNNIVRKGTGNGIQVFGFGTNYVYNNLVINAGNSGQDGVFVDDRPVAGYPGTKLIFVNNTIVKPGNFGIKLSNNYGSFLSGSVIANNLIVQPDLLGKFSSPYISVYTAGAVTVANNNSVPSLSTAGFVDTLTSNFRLRSNASSVNIGQNTTLYGVVSDLDNAPRPSGSAYDIGAYEYIENNLIAPTPANESGDYSTILQCVSVNSTGWTTFYDKNYKPVFELDRNGENISSICWSNRIVTNTLRSHKSYFGNAGIENGAFFQRNYLLDKKGAPAGSNTKLRLIVTGAELAAFIDSYNQQYGSSCTIADLRVVQYTGKNADLEYANNIYSASLYTSITPNIVSYGSGNSLRYLEFSAVPKGEFWIALNCPPSKTGSIAQNAGPIGGSNSTSLRAWFRADLSSLPNATKIAQWNDVSGNQNNATQTLATAQPSYVAASSVLNNQATLSFNANSLDLPIDINADKTPFLTVYAVAAHNTNSLLSKIWGHDAGNYGRGAGLHSLSGGGYGLTYFNGGVPNQFGTTTAAKGFVSKNSYFPEGVKSSFNGIADVSQSNINNVLGKSVMTLGNVTSNNGSPNYNEFWNGQIAEVLVFNSLLSIAQETILENYLSARYNLPLSAAKNIYLMDDSLQGNYDNDVTGIGMATDSSAVLESGGLDMLSMNNPSSLQLDEWLFIGHNGKSIQDSIQTQVPAGINARLKKEWRASERGDVGTVDIEFNVNGISWIDSVSQVKLLLDVNNNGSFADETVAGGGVVSGEWIASGLIVFRNISLNNSERVTLGFESGLASTSYVFNGSGNFSNPANWLNSKVPTAELPGMFEIIINPSVGDCILDIPFTLKTGMKLTVAAGKNFIVR